MISNSAFDTKAAGLGKAAGGESRAAGNGATVTGQYTRTELGLPQSEAEPFSVTVARNRNGCVLAMVQGAIDATTIDQLDRAFAAQPGMDTRAFVLDLTRVSFLSISGLRVMVDLLARTNEVGVPLELVVDTHAVRRALDCVGLSDVFSTHIERTAALAAVDAAELDATL
ncbi:STAS domain-containing protein [Amycolatopsis anabasis]|uniref:STAS domain-containing protein n=1 Tax=Amycolatopsis anabasis TaxID=1840409 RepID=UPI00131B66A4|nr:STAS domain-containing protein [Amycolatopsis anabasis]